MFFFGIFGIQFKEKEIKIIKNIICRACGKMSSYSLIAAYNYFHIFFIPIFKWNRRYYLKARCCSSVFEISEDTFNDIIKNKKSDINVNDFELKDEFINSDKEVSECGSCGRTVDSGFEYCPYCGNKL